MMQVMKPKSVDGVLGSLAKAIGGLDKVEQKSLKTADKLEGRALHLSTTAERARTEAARAKKVRGNLEKLIEA